MMQQRIKEELFPDDKKRQENEKRAFNTEEPKFFRFLKFAIPSYVGYQYILLKTAAISAGAATWPILGATLVGLPITLPFWVYFSRGLRELMCQQSPALRMPVMFLFHASMAVLSGFIGLAIVTACTSALGVNPFVLPCLIAVAVAGAIVAASAFAVAYRTRYIVRTDSPESAKLPGLVSNAIFGKNNRPFHAKRYIDDSQLIVTPIGQTEDEAPQLPYYLEEQSIGKYLGSLFNKNKSRNDSSACNNNDNNNEENCVIVYG